MACNHRLLGALPRPLPSIAAMAGGIGRRLVDPCPSQPFIMLMSSTAIEPRLRK